MGFSGRMAWFRDRIERRLRGERGESAPQPENPRAHGLRALLDLDEVQLGFVEACVYAAADPLLHAPLVSLGGTDARRGLSLATYAALTGADHEVAAIAGWLAGDPLVLRLGFLAPATDGLLPGSTPYVPAARLVSYLAGSDATDAGVARIGGVVALPEVLELDASHAEIADRLAVALASTERVLVVVVGPRGVGRRTVVASAAARSQRSVVAIDASRAAESTENLVLALHREAILRGAIPLIGDASELATGEHAAQNRRTLARVIDAADHTCVVTTTDPGFDCPVVRQVIRFELRAPDAPTRVGLWRTMLGDSAVEPVVIEELAMRYPLGPGAIRAAARSARRATTEPLTRSDLIGGVRSSVAERFGGLADRLDVTDRWEDVVLPPETLDQVNALVSRVRHAYRVYEEWRFPRTTARGGGVAALFSGPPGTGKTLVAGVVARELDRDLFRVDLSRVVSKWVGETEKQLGELFDAAESSDALLLFDEADSLFAKRTEVKSSSDRYANLEVNYLLQRIETFHGVTILTTNLDTSIDAALRRRLAAHIVFWPPDHDERLLLWKRFATCGAPVTGTLQLDDLAAEFPDMTGANIRNASLAAAFLAAGSNEPLSHDLLVRAARSEYRAMGRVLGRK